jgi:NADH-quinone oxidoreductase subunit A
LTSGWQFLVYFAAVIALAAGMIGLSYFLGQRHKDRQTGEPYESGIVSTGSARMRFDAKFYLMAMFFVIFDLESMFILAWAVAARQAGWSGYVEALIFVGVLVAALVYLWRIGALDWNRRKS